MAIEVLLVDNIGNVIPGAIVQHQAADNRLLRLQRVRRNLEVVDALA